MVYDVNSLDMVGERNDGGIELYIISTGEMDDTQQSQKLLLDKVQNYLKYINSAGFKKEFPNVSEDNVWIIVKFEVAPSALICDLCKRIAPWVEENGGKFAMYIDEH